jgi:2-dehydropantoate 2-reductase
MKILFAGLGGVGGYYGGMLAAKYHNSSDVQVLFLARGEHLQKIKSDGIEIITENSQFVANPHLVSDNVYDFGTVDYVVISTKSYDLELIINQIRPTIGDNTVVLPLLNGVDISERIEQLLPNTTVWRGCSYIVARKSAPGIITTSGKLHRLNFGFNNQFNDKLQYLEQVMTDAGIDAKYCKDIHNEIWKKFCFISVTASLTCYYNVGFAELLETPEYKKMFVNLIVELVKVAKAEGADQDLSMIDRAFHRIGSIPRGQTTSMHSDMKAGRKIELHTLTGIVVDLARKHSIKVPHYEKIYESLCLYI